MNQMLQFLRFYLTSTTVRSLHSPALFELFSAVFDDAEQDDLFADIERHRSSLLASDTPVTIHDLGAGSRKGKGAATLGWITRNAASSPRKCRMLALLARQLHPRTLVEIGSAVGISTAYCARAAPECRIWSLEGNPDLAEASRRTIAELGLSNVSITEGPFESSLPALIEQTEALDMVIIDGNHRYEPTLEYFEVVGPALSQRAVVVVDDIRWSSGMWRAWKELKRRPSVGVSVDLFSIGLLFVNADFRCRQHLRAMPNRMPWSVIRG